MAKQQRMATITLVAIACAVVPGATDWQVPIFALWLKLVPPMVRRLITSSTLLSVVVVPT